METILDEISREVAVCFRKGMMADDIKKHDRYEIKDVRKDGLLLEHKPALRGEKKDDLFVGYDELIRITPSNRLLIDGFYTVNDSGAVNNLEKIKRAIKDTIDSLEIEEKRIETSKLAQEKSELQKLKDEALQAKERAEQAKERAEDERMTILMKRKSKRVAKLTRLNEEQERERIRLEKEAEAEAQRKEQERIAEENKKRHQRNVVLAGAKSKAMQQRLRLIARPHF